MGIGSPRRALFLAVGFSDFGLLILDFGDRRNQTFLLSSAEWGIHLRAVAYARLRTARCCNCRERIPQFSPKD
jgi:hypothetical protein